MPGTGPHGKLTKQPATGEKPTSKLSSKYDVLNRPSQRLIDVSAALHQASESLGLFRVNKG